MACSFKNRLSVFMIPSFLLGGSVAASWIIGPIEMRVQESPIVVEGQIATVDIAPPSEMDTMQDVAHLRVGHIFKNQTNRLIGRGTVLTFHMHSSRALRRTGTFFWFEKGKKGIWLLEFSGGEFRVRNPGCFVNAGEKSTVLAALNESSAPNKSLKPTNPAQGDR